MPQPESGVSGQGVGAGAPESTQAPPIAPAPMPGTQLPSPASPPLQNAPTSATAVQAPLVHPPAEANDELPQAGYVPGYRGYPGLGLQPFVPRVDALPGGVTTAYGAPMPAREWTFRFSGYLSATLQTSLYERRAPTRDQSKLAFHVPPQTLDEYGSFLGTGTMPGQWVALNFAYGHPAVTANVSFNTWNPTQPTTYYQIGSQYFVNNAYLQFTLPPIGDLRVTSLAGYFYRTYGNLSQYGGGIYTSPIVGGPRGVGEVITGEYDLGAPWALRVEHGFTGVRNGLVPKNVLPADPNGGTRATFPAAWVHHAHLGLVRARGAEPSEPEVELTLHYMFNWAQDERPQRADTRTTPGDDTTTRQIDESYIRDPKLVVYALNATVNSPIWGFVGAAASYIRGRHVFPLRGLNTFGSEGNWLTDRWWGGDTGGTGSLVAASVNYSVSVGKLVSYPVPFSAGPDLVVNTGFVFAKSTTDSPAFDGRARHKYGADLMYTFFSFMGAGLRVDRVVPNSRDSGESFEVMAPRLVFKSDWNSRDSITLLYAKWFYGPRSHPEASAITAPDRVDDELVALNVSMWW